MLVVLLFAEGAAIGAQHANAQSVNGAIYLWHAESHKDYFVRNEDGEMELDEKELAKPRFPTVGARGGGGGADEEGAMAAAVSVEDDSPGCPSPTAVWGPSASEPAPRGEWQRSVSPTLPFSPRKPPLEVDSAEETSNAPRTSVHGGAAVRIGRGLLQRGQGRRLRRGLGLEAPAGRRRVAALPTRNAAEHRASRISVTSASQQQMARLTQVLVTPIYMSVGGHVPLAKDQAREIRSAVLAAVCGRFLRRRQPSRSEAALQSSTRNSRLGERP